MWTDLLRHSHSLGIGTTKATALWALPGTRDSVRQGVPIASVVLGNTEVMVQNGVNGRVGMRGVVRAKRSVLW